MPQSFRISLRNAAILQDIAPARLQEHLRQQGLDELWNLLAQAGSKAGQPQNLLQLARRPLFLGLMTAVAKELCQGSGLRQGESEEDFLWRLHLDYWLKESQLDRIPPPDLYRKYTQKQSLHWLHCLARWMQAEQKVKLQIDELQPTMLKSYWRFVLLYGLVVSLAFGLEPFGLRVYGWLFSILAFGSWVQFFMIVANDRITIEAFRPLRLPASWQDMKAFSAKLARWLIISLAIGLALGLLCELISGFVETEKIVHGSMLAVSFSLTSGLFAGLLVGLSTGLKAVAGPLNETAHPEQRLKDALRSSLLLFPLFVLAGLLLFVQVMFSAERLGIAVGPSFKMQNFYRVLFLAAILSFFLLGIHQVFQHYLLRLCLCWEGQLPLRLVPWLEAMQQRKVLQRVGGSYHFLHKQLQEYLAKQP